MTDNELEILNYLKFYTGESISLDYLISLGFDQTDIESLALSEPLVEQEKVADYTIVNGLMVTATDGSNYISVDSNGWLQIYS